MHVGTYLLLQLGQSHYVLPSLLKANCLGNIGDKPDFAPTIFMEIARSTYSISELSISFAIIIVVCIPHITSLSN